MWRLDCCTHRHKHYEASGYQDTSGVKSTEQQQGYRQAIVLCLNTIIHIYDIKLRIPTVLQDKRYSLEHQYKSINNYIATLHFLNYSNVIVESVTNTYNINGLREQQQIQVYRKFSVK